MKNEKSTTYETVTRCNNFVFVVSFSKEKSFMKKIKIKINWVSAFGNCCNFCFTQTGLTDNVNEIEGHGIVIRMCDDCLKELIKQKEELLKKKEGLNV